MNGGADTSGYEGFGGRSNVMGRGRDKRTTFRSPPMNESVVACTDECADEWANQWTSRLCELSARTYGASQWWVLLQYCGVDL